MICPVERTNDFFVPDLGFSGDIVDLAAGCRFAIVQTVLQPFQHRRYPSRELDVFHIMRPRGFDIGYMASLFADPVESAKVEIDPRFMRDRHQMQYRIAGTAESHIDYHGVLPKIF
jgi:hypothetical protein